MAFPSKCAALGRKSSWIADHAVDVLVSQNEHIEVPSQDDMFDPYFESLLLYESVQDKESPLLSTDQNAPERHEQSLQEARGQVRAHRGKKRARKESCYWRECSWNRSARRQDDDLTASLPTS